MYAEIGDGNANLVLGQTVFTNGTPNTLDGRGFNQPYNIAVDTNTGRVYLSDTFNNRVLWWNNTDSLTNGEEAAGVVGQANLQSNTGALGINRLQRPRGIAVDSSGNLWVADSQNNRVLCFSAPLSTGGMNASIVLGQHDFTHFVDCRGIHHLYQPYDVAFDTAGNLWVADTSNNRAVRFDKPFISGEDASIVLGQGSFDAFSEGRSQSRFNGPYGITVDGQGDVWVADSENYRILYHNKAPSFCILNLACSN